jgi:hypothetical protein
MTVKRYFALQAKDNRLRQLVSRTREQLINWLSMCIKKNDTTERVNTDTTTQPVQCPAFFFFTAGCF